MRDRTEGTTELLTALTDVSSCALLSTLSGTGRFLCSPPHCVLNPAFNHSQCTYMHLSEIQPLVNLLLSYWPLWIALRCQNGDMIFLRTYDILWKLKGHWLREESKLLSLNSASMVVLWSLMESFFTASRIQML